MSATLPRTRAGILLLWVASPHRCLILATLREIAEYQLHPAEALQQLMR
jgi:hypothetical protein